MMLTACQIYCRFITKGYFHMGHTIGGYITEGVSTANISLLIYSHAGMYRDVQGDNIHT